MPKPWTLLDAVETDEGLLELRRRGERDFLVSIGKRVLMSSTFTRSEQALARLGCEAAREREAPRVLVGGLGLGYTLRAALDVLPPSARVVVAELNPIVVRWCRGPAAPASGHALEDPRVEVIAGDVTDRIREAAAGAAFDAILLDLYVGPGRTTDADPLYGRAATERARDALTRGGTYAVWGEERDPAFERRLRGAGLSARSELVRGGGPTHVVYLAQKP